MGRCKYEKLTLLEPAFSEIRNLEKIKEPKPGIFYFKSDGFLHFHDKDNEIWADIKIKTEWVKMPIPAKITTAFVRKFTSDVIAVHKKLI